MQLKRWGFLGAVLLFSLLLAYLLRFSVPALADLERSTLDWRFSWRGAESVSESPIVLVAIDNASFEMLPERWPWPRNYYAHAVENLTAAGAKAIGIDVIFDVPDPGDSTRDEQLARIVRGKPVVLARKLERSERLSTLWQLTDPIPVLREAADPNLGLVSISADPDGIYRRYPIAMPFYNRLLNSFALEMLRVYLGISPATQPVPLEDGFRFGERFIPQFGDGGMMINYAGPRGTFPVYSMSSLLDDGRLEMGPDTLNAFNNHLLPDSVFQDKLVLIGSTVAELHDNHPTPFMNFGGITREMSGVEILANAIRTLLDQNYLYRFSGFWQFVIVLLLAALVLLLATRLPVLPAMGISFLMALLWVALAFWLFSHQALVVEMLLPVLAVSFTYVGATVYRYLETQREKRQILGAFEQYVPPRVVEELLAHPEKLTLGGEERVMTVLFSDVANFTTISESLTPRDLVNLINAYLSEMTDIILSYDGIIDKYEGDAIMAEFGAPVYYEEHAIKACGAALDMQARLKVMGRQARRKGLPVLNCRVGINTGNMIVGNMGSRQVFDYTVIGDEVNLASRLEGANKAYGTRNMISESTYQAVREHFVTRPLDALRVKGKQRPVQVYELLARIEEPLEEDFKTLLAAYQVGFRQYRNRDWQAAAESFRQCLRLRPDDGPSREYLRRVLEFAQEPPGPDWDGVFEMRTK